MATKLTKRQARKAEIARHRYEKALKGRMYNTVWEKAERNKLKRRMLRAQNPKTKKKTVKPEPKKAVDTFDKKKKPTDYAANIANEYLYSMASEASMTGNYFGGQY